MTAFPSQLTTILQEQIPKNLLTGLPRGWKRIGHVAIILLHDSLIPYQSLIGNACLSVLQGIKTITRIIGPTVGIYRTPNLEIIAGESSTETVHKELECQFEIDAAQLTFSSGNHFERKRMIELVRWEAKVIDMFACVGNLSIPISVHKQAQVIGIEVNPLAYEYLSRNINRNKIDLLYHPHFGDNRDITPKNWADHVIMGCWDCDDTQITNGIAALKTRYGGWIHYHEVVPPHQQVSAIKRFNKCLTSNSIKLIVKNSHSRLVKGVGPHWTHFVTDIHLIPT